MSVDRKRGTLAEERKSAGVPKLPKAVRDYCLECEGGRSGVAKCPSVVSCKIWLFRFGRNPTSGEIEEWTVAKSNQ